MRKSIMPPQCKMPARRTRGSGATCYDDFDECSFGNPCMHRGICSNTIGSYRCSCLHGWFGNAHCDIKDNSTTVRNCTPGWMGEWCQDQCLNDSMCRHTEVCKKRGRGLHCLCSPGWSSRNCSVDIDECTQTPCSSNMLCTNTPGSYLCSCKSGLTGSQCDSDIDECTRNPCEHSSTCINAHASYNCTCANGWQGTNCENDINECENYPCNSTYVCENNPGSFSCSIKQYSASGKDTTKMHIIIGAVLGSILMLCSIVTWIGILKYRWCSSRDKRLIRDDQNVPKEKTNNKDKEEKQRATKQQPTHQHFINKKWVH
ncbi:fibropellin-1-like [Ruditapes philippinarum]|uniref:fibropellin-1-like n=1 Tax=Ruditapes philippinarum TaxID=129788 RepID=UPI00295A784F|nr:fibropellin-1-like [Ruditapes philippinarum]